MRQRPSPLPLVLALAVAAGCTAGGPGLGPGGPKKPVAKTSPGSSASSAPGGPASTAPGAGKPLPLGDALRPLPADAPTVALTGKVKLVSDQGGAIISNNGGAIISDQGGSVISDQGGSLVSNNGGGLTSKVKRVLLAAGAPPEALLADAEVEFLDGAGRVLVDAKGAPVVGRTDRQGQYRFTGQLPAEGLVARIRLWNGGVLLAMRAKDAPAAAALDLDTASTVGAAYVLERYVQRRSDVFARLPAHEADALRADVEGARAKLPVRLSYAPDALLAAADALKRDDAGVDKRLEGIKAILLVGQAELGDGRPANQVSLSFPNGLAGTAAGDLYVAEYGGGRVRRVGADGLIYRFAGGLATSTRREGPVREVNLDTPTGLAIGPDGTLYLADQLASRVLAIKDGQVRGFAGTGEARQGAPGGPAAATPILQPLVAVPGPDGRVWISENGKADKPGRLLAVDAGGVLHEEPAPPTNGGSRQLVGLAVAPDGTLWALDADPKARTLYRRLPGGDWTALATALAVNDRSGVQLLPDGDVLVSEQTGGRIVRVKPDGQVVAIAGGKAQGFVGDGGPSGQAGLTGPAGMWLSPAGTLYVSEVGTGLVRAIAPPLDGTGRITTVAGTRGVTQQGDALNISLSTPGGLALDRLGRLLMTEGGGATLKRLEGGQLTLVAGTSQGTGGDGGPAALAQLDAPTGVAVLGDDTYVLEASFTPRVRKIDARGVITTVVGSGQRGRGEAVRAPGLTFSLRRPLACAGGPDGRLYWVDNENHQVCRLNADGTAEVVCGTGLSGDEGDGGPARQAKLSRPTGLAFDAAGALYVSDTGNFRIRRVTGLDQPEPSIAAFLGVPLLAGLEVLKAGEPAGPTPGEEALLLGPTGLAFAPDGTLYVAEAGTAKLGTLLGTLGIGDLLAEVPRKAARIRRVTGVAAGKPVCTVLAGDGTGLLDRPGTDDSLLTPSVLLVDPGKGLYVLDTGNNAVKLIPQAALAAR